MNTDSSRWTLYNISKYGGIIYTILAAGAVAAYAVIKTSGHAFPWWVMAIAAALSAGWGAFSSVTGATSISHFTPTTVETDDTLPEAVTPARAADEPVPDEDTTDPTLSSQIGA